MKLNPDAPQLPTMRFTERAGGQVICIVCREVDGGHLPTCPIVALDANMKELTSHIGVFVANMRDTLEAIARIVHSRRD